MLALEVAHNVEVGDYAFGEKNYNGALLRYNEPNFQRLHVAVGGEHDVDIPNRVPGRLPEFASLGDEVLFARGAVDKPQPCEDPLDRAVWLQVRRARCGRKRIRPNSDQI